MIKRDTTGCEGEYKLHISIEKIEKATEAVLDGVARCAQETDADKQLTQAQAYAHLMNTLAMITTKTI